MLIDQRFAFFRYRFDKILLIYNRRQKNIAAVRIAGSASGRCAETIHIRFHTRNTHDG